MGGTSVLGQFLVAQGERTLANPPCHAPYLRPASFPFDPKVLTALLEHKLRRSELGIRIQVLTSRIYRPRADLCEHRMRSGVRLGDLGEVADFQPGRAVDTSPA